MKERNAKKGLVKIMNKVALPQVDVRELLKSGAHFGHRTSHWHPAMEPYIHSQKGGIYIIDLIQTADLLKIALEFAYNTSAKGGKVLFVGTKRQLKSVVQKAAEKSGMPYVNQRWLGGTLTNFDTFKKRVEYLRSLEEQRDAEDASETMNKRETSQLKDEIEKLNLMLGGIKDLDKLPEVVFVTDIVTERNAVKEAKKLGIPVVAIVDTNGNPHNADYVIPANDDAISAVGIVCDLIADSIELGIKEHTVQKEDSVKKDEKAPKSSKQNKRE
jgi:small subunit ribosomal protein S2